MFLETPNICACETNNKHRLKIFVAVLFFMSIIPAVLAKTVIEYNNGGYEDVIVVMPKSENAKECLVQIDDNINFMSPVIERKISAYSEMAVFRLEKKNRPYYWRYQMKDANGLAGDWQNQLEVRTMIPSENELFFMEGNNYKITEPVKFYFYVRNDADYPNTYEYDVSIRTESIVDDEKVMEVKDVLFGKVVLGPKSSKLVKTEMKIKNELEVNKKYYALARVNDYRTIEDFYIEPSYKADIFTKELERMVGKKVKLYITNTSDENIRELKVNLVTSYNLKVDKWWDKREVTDMPPGATEYFEWDVDVLSPGKSEINIDIISDGGMQRIQKVFMPFEGSLVAERIGDLNVSVNEISELKINFANAVEHARSENIELVISGPEDAKDKIEVLNNGQMLNFGAGSSQCAKEFLDNCSVETTWKIIAKEAGAYQYYLKNDGFEITSTGPDSTDRGNIYVFAGKGKLNLTINGDEFMSEISSNKKEPFNYDVFIYNYAEEPDNVKIKIVPKGKGWYVHFYDEKELKNGNEFEVIIKANSSRKFRLVLNPESNDRINQNLTVTNPFEVRILASSSKNSENHDELRAIAKIE